MSTCAIASEQKQDQDYKMTKSKLKSLGRMKTVGNDKKCFKFLRMSYIQTGIHR